MKTLQDAWDWYESARVNLDRMKRLRMRHWNDESLSGTSIWSDERFKQLEAEDILVEVTRALDPLEDLGILVLFSVFEATVRDHFETTVRDHLERRGQVDRVEKPHPILRHATESVLAGIRRGSFSNKLLAPL